MKRFNFFKYTTLANKVHTTYFDYWFFKHLTQGGEAPTEPVEGEGTEFTLSPTSNKTLAVVTPKGDTSQGLNPTPDNPQDVNVVTGTQTLTITNGTDEQTYPITLGSVELCKIGDYQDYIYKSGDDWYKYSEVGKMVFNGSENWTVTNTGTVNFYYALSNLNLGFTQNTLDLVSNYGSPGEVGNTNTEQGIIIVPAGDNNQLRIRYGTEMTVANWQSKLSTTNMVLYYVRKTPTYTKITDATLLSNLNTLLTDGYLKKGTNTIKTTATGTNLPTIIYIKTN